MNWIDIAKLIAPIAPAAGSVLGGLIPFPGGSLIGEQFGKIIAKQLGVPETPAAVSEALANSTEETKRVKINAALEQARAEIQGFVDMEKSANELLAKSLTETNVTIRAEVGHENLFFTGWRPAIGWVFVLFALSFGFMLTVAAGAAAFFDNANPLQILSDAWPIFLAYFGTLGLMVGVYIPSRSMEKKIAIENAVPMPNANPIPAKPPVKPIIQVKPTPPGRVTTNFDGE